MNKDKLLQFLKSQQVIVIAVSSEDLWIFDAYYVIDKDFKIYFVSRISAKHSQQILKRPKIVFSVVWFNQNNHMDREAVQGQGICRLTKSDNEIITGIKLHNKNFPEFKSRLTVEYIKSKNIPSKVWVIEPTYMKFWNDKLFGEKETEEFFF